MYKRNAKNNVKGGKNAIKVLNNNNSIQVRKNTVKKWLTDGSLASLTRFGHDFKRERGGTGKHAASTLSERKGM